MEHVLLENRSTSTRFGPFTLLRRPHGVIFAQGNASLRAQPMRGGVDMQGQGGPYAQWRIEERSGGVCIINVGLASKRLAARAGPKPAARRFPSGASVTSVHSRKNL